MVDYYFLFAIFYFLLVDTTSVKPTLSSFCSRKPVFQNAKLGKLNSDKDK